MENRRRDEIEAKKNRLAELRRLRELRQQQQQKQQLHSQNQPDKQQASRKDLYEYVDSLVAAKSPSPSQSSSPSVQPPGSEEPEEKPSIEDVRQKLTFFSMDIADFPSEPALYTEVITYDKQVQTTDVYASNGSVDDEEDAVPDIRHRVNTNYSATDYAVQTANAAVSMINSEVTVKPASDGERSQTIDKMTESSSDIPILLADEKYNEINARPDFNDFLTRASKVAERVMDEEYDVLVDYGIANIGTENDQAEDGLKQIADLQHPSSAYKRAVTDLDWSSKFPELVLGSFTASSSISASPGGLVQVWNMHMRERPEYIFQASSDVLTAKFSPFNPNIIMGGCYNGQVLLWDMRSNEQPVMSSPLSVVGHSFPVYCLEMAGTENLYSIVSCSTDGTVCSWAPDLLAKPTNKIVLKLPTIRAEEVGPTSMVLSTSDPDNFFIGTEEGSIYTCYLADRAGVKAGLNASLAYAGAVAPVTGLDIHPFAGDLADNGDLLISSSVDWNIRTHQTLNSSQALQQEMQPLTSTNGTDDTNDISYKLNSHPKLDLPLFTFNCTEAPYDVKWNPARASVFASVDAGGYLEIKDLLSPDIDVHIARASPQHERQPGKARNKNKTSNTSNGGTGESLEGAEATEDELRSSRALNKVAWEKTEGRRLATGGLDGIISIFDSSPCLDVRPSMSSEDWTRMRKLVSKAQASLRKS